MIEAGVDEAGRGPLAGPVFAAAVILDSAKDIQGLDDSKKISEKKRELLAKEIQETAVSWCIASSTSREIDEINILKASLLAMRRAIEGMKVTPDIALVDGQYAPETKCKVQTIVKGDQLKKNIMAASILAKVGRDNYMKEVHTRYPEYGFNKHKGYPTKMHLEALKLYGASDEHRVSFKPVKMINEPS